jgi:hypothetical protein
MARSRASAGDDLGSGGGFRAAGRYWRKHALQTIWRTSLGACVRAADALNMRGFTPPQDPGTTNACVFRHADGRARTGQWDQEQQAHDVTLLIVFNAHHDVVKFKLPRAAEFIGWSRLIDTNDPELPARHFRLGAVYEVTGRSLLLLERVPVKKRPRALAT